jgi:hypothetical protein
MSVSGELLCSFELLKPLDSAALKQQMKKSRNRRSSMMHQSPVCYRNPREWVILSRANFILTACDYGCSELLMTPQAPLLAIIFLRTYGRIYTGAD